MQLKDGLVKLLMKESITHGISVNIVNNKLILDFHVIVAYGVSIVTVCDNLIHNVKYKVEKFTGLEIEKPSFTFTEAIPTMPKHSTATLPAYWAITSVSI